MVRNPLVLLAVHRFPGYNGHLKLRAAQMCRDEKDLPDAMAFYAQSRSQRSRRAAASMPPLEKLQKQAELDYRRLRSGKIEYRVLGSPAYPAALAHIDDPPLLLFVRGELESSHNPAVALVGTRRPSAHAQREACRFAMEFALAEYPVVSGLAFGIDKAAHEGALAAKGTTWAVLAGGLDRPSPGAHRPLAARILEGGGALLGEIPPGEFPARYAFPRRNRILSGLTRGCVVFQAPAKSGALITASLALDQNRDVYVARCGLEGAASEGTRGLEAQGAPVVSGAKDIIRDWSLPVDTPSVETLAVPETAGDLVYLMKREIEGQLHCCMGGWFEYCIA
ncbi:MAG: DNA-protecting protein DprA [Spirochaetales bacterium]|nr:MAG: DNA-protecting protein DprA [Spirochaetales bacterium]